jgi:hypothetical protein
VNTQTTNSTPLTAPTVAPKLTVATVPSRNSTARRTTKRTVKKTVVKKTAKTATKTTKTATKKTTAVTTSSGTLTWTVVGAGSVGLAVRDSPSRTAAISRRVTDGTALKISCQARGDSVTNNALKRASVLWDHLSSGGYVAHVYVSGYQTATPNTRALRACAATTASTLAPADASVAASPPTTPTEVTTPTVAPVTSSPGVVSAGATVASTVA